MANLCKIPTDDKRSARAINDAAKWLLGKNQTPERLNEFLNWWNENDWRGKRGDPPKPGDIVTDWPKFEAGPKPQRFAAQNNYRPTTMQERPEFEILKRITVQS